MAFLDLLDCVGVVVAGGMSVLRIVAGRERAIRCDRDVAAVEDCCPAVKGVGVEGDVVAAAESNFA